MTLPHLFKQSKEDKDVALNVHIMEKCDNNIFSQTIWDQVFIIIYELSRFSVTSVAKKNLNEIDDM